MPTIIDMLEKLGQDANLQTPEALQAAKADLADQVRIQNQPMNFIVAPADDDDDSDGDSSDEKTDEKALKAA